MGARAGRIAGASPPQDQGEMRVMAEHDLVTIPARHGKAARLRLGQRLKLVNTHGTQVVDAWAFIAYELGEFMSMQHSRVAYSRIQPPALTVSVPPMVTFLKRLSVSSTLSCRDWTYSSSGSPRMYSIA